MAKQLIENAKRGNIFFVDPSTVVIVGLDTADGPDHYLFDERVTLPIDPMMVANIRALGVIEPCAVEVITGVPHVVDGRRRIMHARAANEALAAIGEPLIQVPVISVKGDESRLASISISLNEIRRADDVLVKAAKACRMLDRCGSVPNVAIAFGVDENTVRQWTKIDSLATPVKDAIGAGKISATAAVKLAKMPRADQVAATEMLVEESAGKRVTISRTTGATSDAPVKPSMKRMKAIIAASADDDAFARGIRYAIGLLAESDVPSVVMAVVS